MTIYSVEPLVDPRWAEFVESHPASSLAHRPEWLNALKDTYGYQPVVYTTAGPGEALTNGFVSCRIYSWLTGRRIVSLPFTDHCDLLTSNDDDSAKLLNSLGELVWTERLNYVELRPRALAGADVSKWWRSMTYSHHELDLRPALNDLFRATHKTGIQQPIRRAEREQLEYSEGNSDTHLARFYELLLLTRRRHGLPPQPIDWFRALIRNLGDRLKIRVASKDGRAVASILTIYAGSKVFYKYGCSDATHHNLGGVPFLIWKTIEDAKGSGLTVLDFGRSDADNPGLIVFKERWNATRYTLTYLRLSSRIENKISAPHASPLVQRVFSRLPDPLLASMGRLLYRHLG